MGKTVGIDLGTTYSLIAYQDPARGRPNCVQGPYGTPLCPSIVSVDPDGAILVGEPARRRLLTQSSRTIYSVKRLMGRGIADVQDELKLFPFELAPESANVLRVRLAIACSRRRKFPRSSCANFGNGPSSFLEKRWIAR